MKIATEKVSPKMAKRWLELYPEGRGYRQRPLSSRTVDRYTADMSAGFWHNDGAPIRFGKSGRLLDGQHRLHAVVRSGLVQEFVVIRDVDDAAFTVMDTGKARTTADVLGSSGYDRAPALAGTAGLILLLLYHRERATKQFLSRGIPGQNDQIRDFIEANPSIPVAVDHAHTKLHLNRVIPRNIAAALLWIFTEGRLTGKGLEFFEKLATGEGLHRGDPILTLREHLIGVRNRRNNRLDYICGTIYAWNRWIRGRTLMRLRVPEKLPEIHLEGHVLSSKDLETMSSRWKDYTARPNGPGAEVRA